MQQAKRKVETKKQAGLFSPACPYYQTNASESCKRSSLTVASLCFATARSFFTTMVTLTVENVIQKILDR